MKKLLTLFLLLSLGLNIGLAVRTWRQNCCAPEQGSRMEHSRHPGFRRGAEGDFWRQVMSRRMERLTRQLDLDSQQRAAFLGRHQAALDQFVEQRRKVHQAREKLLLESSRPEFQLKALRPLMQEVGRQQARLDSLVTENMFHEMELLTPRQRQKYLQILPLNRLGGMDRGPRHGGP